MLTSATRLRPPRTPTAKNVPNYTPSCMVDIRFLQPRLSGLSVPSSNQAWVWKASRGRSWSLGARTTSCIPWPSRLVQPAKLPKAALASAQGFRPWPKAVNDDDLSVNSDHQEPGYNCRKSTLLESVAIAVDILASLDWEDRNGDSHEACCPVSPV